MGLSRLAGELWLDTVALSLVSKPSMYRSYIPNTSPAMRDWERVRNVTCVLSPRSLNHTSRSVPSVTGSSHRDPGLYGGLEATHLGTFRRSSVRSLSQDRAQSGSHSRLWCIEHLG